MLYYKVNIETRDTYKRIKTNEDINIDFIIPTRKECILNKYDLRNSEFISAMADIMIKQLKDDGELSKIIDWNNYPEKTIFALELKKDWTANTTKYIYRNWKDENGNDVITDEGKTITKKEAKKMIMAELDAIRIIFNENEKEEMSA